MLKFFRKRPEKKLFKRLVKAARRRDFDITDWLEDAVPVDEELRKTIHRNHYVAKTAAKILSKRTQGGEEFRILSSANVEAAISSGHHEILFFVIIAYYYKQECDLAEVKGALTRLNEELHTKFMV